MMKKKTWSDIGESGKFKKAKEIASKKPEPMRTPPISSNPNIKDDDLADLTEQEVADAMKEIDKLDKELAFVLQGVNTEQISLVGLSSGDNVAQGSGTVRDILIRALPKRKRDIIKRSYMHYDRDDLLGDLIDLKHDFAIAGLSLQIKPPAYTKPEEVTGTLRNLQEKINNIFYKLDITKIISDIINDWLITDNMILYWQVDNEKVSSGNSSSETTTPDQEFESEEGIPGLIALMTLNPGELDWDNSLGSDILLVDIPEQLKKKVKNAFWQARRYGKSNDDVFTELVNSGIGPKWIDAIMSDKEQVQLSKEDGDNWLIRTKSRKYTGLSTPSMNRIFITLESRNMLVEGEFSTAFMMKHFIQLIKQGESITTGPLAGSTKNYMDVKAANSILKLFSGVAKAVRAAVNHTTSVEFVFPPKEMFDGAKFISADDRIFNWSGVVRSLMTGDGQNYGGGYLGIKKLISILVRVRNEVRLMFIDFFNNPIIRKQIGIPDGYTVTPIFDSNNLKEPAQLLNEVKFLVGSGISDPRTAARELDRDPDALLASTIRSREEQDNLHVWEPIVPIPGAADSNQGGRPPNPGTTQNEETRTQPPSGQAAK